MTYRTQGELRATLMARLGMGAMGASGGASQALMNSFLSNGQTQLYWAQDWKHMIDYAEKVLGVDQNMLDYPTAGVMNPDAGCSRDRRVLRIETVQNGQWRRMEEGISTEHWSTMDTQSFPSRFDRYAQVMIYPKANQLYTLRFWYVADLGRFTVDSDRASLDDEMILLHAITNGKAHYRHPDASLYQGQLSTLMASLRGQSFNLQGVYRRGEGPPNEPKPAVVGRDV